MTWTEAAGQLDSTPGHSFKEQMGNKDLTFVRVNKKLPNHRALYLNGATSQYVKLNFKKKIRFF